MPLVDEPTRVDVANRYLGNKACCYETAGPKPRKLRSPGGHRGENQLGIALKAHWSPALSVQQCACCGTRRRVCAITVRQATRVIQTRAALLI